MSSQERNAIDQGWFYVHEPDDGAHVPDGKLIRAKDGTPLTRRLHGYHAVVQVENNSGQSLHVGSLLRAAAAGGRRIEHLESNQPLRVSIDPSGTADAFETDGLHLDASNLKSDASHHMLDRRVQKLEPKTTQWPADTTQQLHEAEHILAFESLLNTDMPHNDKEISQGVLHMLSPLKDRNIKITMACVKMPIVGEERPPTGLESIDPDDLTTVDLVLITLLEGYWHGAVALVEHLRQMGCRAHIALGGVMPTLTPEHVAAHFEGVTFVARGAGEYFIPRLVSIMGQSDVDTPFTDAQCAALRRMHGLIAVDRAGKKLIAARPGQVATLTSMDRVHLDLSHVQPRHVEGGIEIITSRGCIHRCSFCSIVGRESYQARSSESIYELLDAYEHRYRQIFPNGTPPNAYRVHIADDDFACDPVRAQSFLRKIQQTPFRLSSIQVSVADLCIRDEKGKLKPTVSKDWLNTLDPKSFADHGRHISKASRLADQQHRNWSSYLQIGVETFSQRELVRLGKGYRVEHIRAVVGALSKKDIHHDAYFIESNTDTAAEDLIESLTELCRLKMRHPLHFHVKFPIVPHLVSYFPTATYRKKVRMSRLDSVECIETLVSPDSHEYDYPLIKHDIPDDPWVTAAVNAGFLTDKKWYTDSFEALRHIWKQENAPPSLMRQIDDKPRQLVFEFLNDARLAEQGHQNPAWPTPPNSSDALEVASGILGPKEEWLQAFQRYTSHAVPRLVVIPTWQCELRCSYCYIPKQDGRVMNRTTMERAIDFLMSSSRDELMLQFFGGEALLEYPSIQHAIVHAHQHSLQNGKRITYILSSNGWSLDRAKLDWLKQYNVKLELSLDGTPQTQNVFRHSRHANEDSYEQGIAPRVKDILESGLRYDVIMVVHPKNAHQLLENFCHISSLGFRRIQINPALGPIWKPEQAKAFGENLFKLGNHLLQEWSSGGETVLINAESKPMPIRLNGEITVDYDGTIYGGNAFLHETPNKSKFRMGHLKDGGCFDRYWLDAPDNNMLLKYSYAANVTQNNLAIGRVLRSFCVWLRAKQGLDKPASLRG